MALRMWASSTANALRISCASKTPAFALSRCFSSGTQLISFPLPIIIFCKLMGWFFLFFSHKVKSYSFESLLSIKEDYLFGLICCSLGWVEICILAWMGEAWRLCGYCWHHWSCPGSSYLCFFHEIGWLCMNSWGIMFLYLNSMKSLGDYHEDFWVFKLDFYLFFTTLVEISWTGK